MRCWRGASTVQTAIDLADPGAENFAESAMRELVHELGIGWPTTQFGLRAEGHTAYADVRVGRHLFELDGKIKFVPVADGGVAERDRSRALVGAEGAAGLPHRVQARDVPRDLSRPRSRPGSRPRCGCAREYESTVARFGTDIGDLAPYVVAPPL